MFLSMDSSSSSSIDRTRTTRTSPSTSPPQTSLDSQLWHACAGAMVQMPALNSKVFYFPQGHAEHTHAHSHGQNSHFAPTFKSPIPPFFPCTVTAIKYMAEPETDEVYVKITLTPLTQKQHQHLASDLERDDHCSNNNFLDNNLEKPASFAKTLTQSDANNGGGFSVPRYCAETIFPRLDYSAEPPVQTIIAKDVHGQCWKFRHIYRGTPRRHLLTTGWSNFVNQKKLVAGDSIVFLRAENGDLCVGIRRAKKGGIGGGNGTATATTAEFWNNHVSPPPSFGYGGGESCVVEAVNCAMNGRAFEVVYYPRGSSPEFCVKASSVRAAMQVQWCSGMRFKMPFETEDSSRISWFMGTISSVQVSDPLHWPDSPWRLLQVVWDEPDLLQNVKCVNPWLVELVSNVPNFHLSPFSPARKKQRFLQDQPDFHLINQIPIPPSSFTSNNLYNIQDHHSFSSGIQGARHAHHQFGLAPHEFHINTLHQPDMNILGGFPRLDHTAQQPARPTFGIYNNTASTKNKNNNNNLEISCLLSVGNPGHKDEESCSNETKASHILLFGKLIHTEQNNSSNSSNSASEGNNSSPKTSIENSSDGGTPWYKDQHKNNELVGAENINILCMAL